MKNESLLTIRPFGEGDLSELSRLIADTVERCYTGVYPPKAVRFFLDYHSPENILRDAAKGITLISWHDETPVATATLIDSYICRVFVHPEYQGKGCGKSLAFEVEKLAMERGIELLELDASLVSRRFWEGLGWRVTAREVEMVEDEALEYYKMSKIMGRGTPPSP